MAVARTYNENGRRKANKKYIPSKSKKEKSRRERPKKTCGNNINQLLMARNITWKQIRQETRGKKKWHVLIKN